MFIFLLQADLLNAMEFLQVTREAAQNMIYLYMRKIDEKPNIYTKIVYQFGNLKTRK